MKLTIGMRCRIKDSSEQWDDYGGKEVLLTERSGPSFGCLVLGQKALKKKDPKTVIDEIAWVDEEDLEHIDSDFEANLRFIDWYQEHEEEFCPY